MRLQPARVVVYLLLAGGLFAELGYTQVWRRLTAGLHGVGVVTPTASALRQARKRLGPAPLRALFDLLRGPAATTATAQVFWRGRLVCAIDGTTTSVPGSPANLARYVRQRGLHGGSGYPMMRITAVVGRHEPCVPSGMVIAPLRLEGRDEVDQRGAVNQGNQGGHTFRALDLQAYEADHLAIVSLPGSAKPRSPAR